MERWVGRVALVTGASAGFGHSIAKRLVEHGMTVIGCARNIGKIQALSESLRGAKGSLTAIQCDLSKEDQIMAMFEKIKKDFGGVDVCVNNAGLSHDAPLLTGSTEQWRHMLDVNVLGLCICTKEAVKSMKERGVDDGHIILMGSMSGHGVVPGVPQYHFYSATKFAVRALTEGIRNELCASKSHIRVTALSPGMAETEFTSRMFPEDIGRAEKVYAIYKPLTADDVTDGVIYALSAPVHVQALADSLKGAKGSLTAIQCDVSKDDQILAMFGKIKKEFGGVDVCVNNAGLSHDAPLLTGSTEQWRHMLDVNVLGLCVCTREAVKSMKERGVDDGHIILMGSMSGHRVVPGAPHIHFYAATKFAVKALTEGIRNELCAMNSHIRVTAISPGMAKTEFNSRMFPDDPERAEKTYTRYTPMTADDVTDSVIYALSAPIHVQVHDIWIRPTECPY